jgi:drug/metabolite transporter (DMT)-like permease
MRAAAPLALLAFAGNSLLCRLALRADAIDPFAFTMVRLVAGALMLALLGRLWRWTGSGRSWMPAAWLATYALGFSWAYVRLDAGLGALLLFGCVQLTMLAAALRGRESLPPVFWIGTATAAAGVVWLVRPGGTAPAVDGVLSMAVAGFAWGRYSLAGRGVTDPAASTRENFVRASVLAVVIIPPLACGVATALARAEGAEVLLGFGTTPRGFVLAAISGAITSGLGYVLWYAALRTMTASRAAALQLAVPVLTALLAVPMLGERPTARLAVASVLVLGGIGLTIQRPRVNAGPR